MNARHHVKLTNGYTAKEVARRPTHYGQPEKGTINVEVNLTEEGFKAFAQWHRDLEILQGSRCGTCKLLIGVCKCAPHLKSER